MPLHEPFQRIKLGQAEVIVDLGGMAVAVFGPLPELPAVHTPGEHGSVLLRLMAEDGEFLPFEIVGADRHHAIDFVRRPFLPGTPVEPDFKLEAFLPNLMDGPKDGVGTNPM